MTPRQIRREGGLQQPLEHSQGLLHNDVKLEFARRFT